MPTKRAKRLSALRRYLVDEMFLTRDGGVYRRSGGTVRP